MSPFRAFALAVLLGCGSSSSGGTGDSGTSADTTPPTGPQGLTATPTSSSAIALSWIASTDDRGVTGYRIFRDGSSLHDTVSTSYGDTGLSASTRYCYQVLAYDAAGNQSSLSAQACATTSGSASSYTLTVGKNGTGAGTVTGSGISCGSDCAETVASGTSITLTAAPASGSTFVSWTGCDAPSGATCTMAMTASKTVTANFSLAAVNYTLAVAKGGTGAGTVTGSGISCGSDCTETVASGTSITLTAAPASGSTFVSWTGCDAPSGATCTMAMTASKTVTANFSLAAVNYTLAVAKGGTGAGTVTGSGISCGSDCTETVASGTSITLTAAPASGSTFVSWTGCDAPSGATCTMAMTASKTVTANFSLAAVNYTLAVAKGGTGAGTVTGSGISCGSDCTETVASGTSITLTAAPASGSTFVSWTGCDAPSGATCTMTMTASKTVTANFNLAVVNYTLTVAKGGTGAGTVTGSGISCGSDCAETVASGTSITLTAAPASGSTFVSWTGCDAPSGATCTMTMTASKTVTANFNLAAVCTPNATRCVTGNLEVQERCNAGGTAWAQESCGTWHLCAASTCRVACGMSSTPANPTVCLVPVGDGVNNGEWTYWTDSRMASGTYIVARSQTGSVGYAPIYSESGEAWPYGWSISSSDVVGVQFKLNQFGVIRHPTLGFRAKRAGIITGYVNNFLVGLFTPTATLGHCAITATFAWTATYCTASNADATSFNYAGGWNSMLLSITGDGFGGAIDLMDVNYVYLTIGP